MCVNVVDTSIRSQTSSCIFIRARIHVSHLRLRPSLYLCLSVYASVSVPTSVICVWACVHVYVNTCLCVGAFIVHIFSCVHAYIPICVCACVPVFQTLRVSASVSVAVTMTMSVFVHLCLSLCACLHANVSFTCACASMHDLI